MPVENADAGLKTRFIVLLVGLWAFVAVVSQLFVQLVIGLSDDAALAFLVVHWLGALVFGGLTALGTLRQLGPLLNFARIEASGTRLEASALDRAIGALPRLTVRLGVMGMVAPVLWMLGSGLVLESREASPAGGLGLFLVLGLFDGTFVGAILFVLAGTWLSGLVERLAGYRGQALSAPGMALRWKISLLGFLLATVPTLLVGSMSYHTAIRLLREEVGVQLGQRLLQLDGEVGGLLAAGAARDAIEAQLSLEAERLGPQTFIHLGRADGSFYRSAGAEPLSPEVYARIREAQAPRGTGLVREAGESYAYAYSTDGSTVSIAPVRRASLQRTGTTMLWLIFGITLCSMVVAALIGFTFASNLGQKLKRMTLMTEEVARGDLTRDARVYSDDEIGLLGASLHTMSENLRRMVRDVSALANQIAGTCSQLLVKSSAISTGAEIQSRSVGEVSSSIEELDENIQEASNNLQALADAAQEAAEAVNKVGEGFNRMLAEMGGLQSTVERTGTIVERMAKSVAEVAGTIKDLSSGAERSALSMAEMDRSISAVTASAADTAQIAQRAIDVAQEGAVAVRRTIEGMDRIVSSTRQASNVIVGLGNRIEAIGSILGVIEEIADQTNLLALNAAIIAAQAGEHGRSFAVVADEIRSLAERTGASTREIAQMISDIQAASEEAIAVMKGGGTIVNEGVTLAKQAGESLSLILVNVQKATENVQGIAANTEGQARASATVTREIARVAEMALRISQSAGQQETAAEELRTAFAGTLNTSQSLGRLVSQQAQENRQAMAAVTSMNEAASRANQAVIGQSAVSEGILRSIEQVREIAKNHAGAAAEMGGATQGMAEKSGRLKQEIEEFKV